LRHSDYEVVRVEEDRVFIVDLDIGGKSVTNDLQFVYQELNKAFPGKRIIYRDTMGRWDEIVTKVVEKYKWANWGYAGVIPYHENLPSPEEITGFPTSGMLREKSKEVVVHNNIDTVYSKNWAVKNTKDYKWGLEE